MMIRISAAALLVALAAMVAIGLPRDAQAQTQIAPGTPRLSSFEPSTGLAAGGTKVTLIGSEFVVGAYVDFGGVPATDVVVVSDSRITVTAPPNQRGPTFVMVTNPDGKFGTSSAVFFTYQEAVTSTTFPLIQTVTPASGSQDGGTTITIVGSRFVAGATLTVSSNLATNVKFINEGMLTAVTPANAPGPASIKVTNPDGQVGTTRSVFDFMYGTERNPAAAAAIATPTPTPAALAPVVKLPVAGIGLMVFSGGNNVELLRVSGCPQATAAFWASDGLGAFVTYVPGTTITAVNAAWNAMFPTSLAANTPLIARCA